MSAPSVELHFNPTDLRPRDLPSAGAFLGSPADALEAALAVARAQMADRMMQEVRGIAEPTQAQLLRIADLAWQAAFWNFRKISAPVLAEAYIRAYRRAEAGDVPMSVIYNLADKHVEKIGDYFHSTSRDALAEGFSTMVNRQLPRKAAANKVLEAYGLTPRQMRAYVSAKQLQTPVDSPIPRAIKAKAREYIDRAFTSRTRRLSRQEEHNIDEQAKQYAWMWMQDKGRLSNKAQKVWITAKDERVCPVCGPLHGKRVGVNERFVTKEGEFWTPGLHPNCRCVVRLIENRFSKALSGGVLTEFNREHPRANDGRFGVKARTKPQTKTIDVDEEFTRIVAQPTINPVRHLTYAYDTEPDLETRAEFASLVAAQPKRRGLTMGFDSPLETRTFKEEALEGIVGVEPMVDFAADLAVDLRTRTRMLAEAKPQLQRTKTPTVALDDPAYAVITHDQLGAGSLDRIRLNHGITFKTNEIAAAQEAGELVQRQVERAVEDMTDTLAKDKGKTIRAYDQETGESFYAKASPQLIQNIADWYGRNATAHRFHEHDDNWVIEDQKVALDWRNQEGETVHWMDEVGDPHVMSRMSYRELGHNYFEMHPQDFEVYVVGIDHVPTAEGAVEDVSGSSKSKEREFSVDADYTLRPDTMNRTLADNWFAVTSYMVEPEHSVELPDE